MSEWQLFNNGLPHVAGRELEIQYAIGKIRAATYGRGVWESDLNSFVATFENINPDIIEVYPNPTKNNFLIDLPINIQKGSFKIYDLSGKLILEDLLNETKLVDCSNFQKGMYLIRMNINGNISSKKLFIY